MYGTSPPPTAGDIQTMGYQGVNDMAMAPYQQPVNRQPTQRPTPYGGIGFGLSGMGSMGPSSAMSGMSMMGTPKDVGLLRMGGMGSMMDSGSMMGMPGMGHQRMGIPGVGFMAMGATGDANLGRMGQLGSLPNMISGAAGMGFVQTLTLPVS